MKIYIDGTREVAVYKGKKYYRLHSSRRRNARVYFTRTTIEREKLALHVAIYREEVGNIPEGHCIHHIDGNPLNNSISNLKAVSREEHGAIHAEWNKKLLSDSLAKARPLIKKWQQSEEGRQHYIKLGILREEARRKREPKRYTCDNCGRMYLSKTSGRTRFCSKACNAKWRRDSGVDNIERSCIICGSVFIIGKYRKAKTCSMLCAQRLKARNRDIKEGTYAGIEEEEKHT